MNFTNDTIAGKSFFPGQFGEVDLFVLPGFLGGDSAAHLADALACVAAMPSEMKDQATKIILTKVRPFEVFPVAWVSSPVPGGEQVSQIWAYGYDTGWERLSEDWDPSIRAAVTEVDWDIRSAL